MSTPISDLLEQLQELMIRKGWWQTVAPSVEAMMSTDPFCINTMGFLEWLQWVYIARLRAILDANGSLPVGAQVAPYAEEALKAEGTRVTPLLALVRELDQALA